MTSENYKKDEKLGPCIGREVFTVPVRNDFIKGPNRGWKT